MPLTHRYFTLSIATLSMAILAQFLFHAEPAIAKGGSDNPTVVTGDDNGSLTVDTDGGSLAVNIIPELTHMGQLPIDHVMFVRGELDTDQCGGNGRTLKALYIQDDALISLPNYQVEVGRVLVITDIYAVITKGTAAWCAGCVLELTLSMGDLEDGGIRLFEAGVLLNSDNVAIEVAVISGNSISGALLPEGAFPCISASVQGNVLGHGLLSAVSIQGYLIDN